MSMEGVELGCVSVGNVHDALKAFGEVQYVGARRVLPIVATPTNAGFPWVSVPDGVFALRSVQGVIDDKPMEPGFHFMAPWSNVKYVVSPQFTVFDTPIKDCPTKDNVFVGIDVFLVCRIFDARKFIDNLSAEKLGDLLKAAQEEAVRNLARATNHQDIYDLVKFDETDICNQMDLKFHDFGVEISDIMITDVKLRPEIQSRLEQETIYQSKNSLQKRKQEFEMTVLRNREILNKRRLEIKNRELAFDEEEKKKRANVAKEIDEIYARRDKMLAEIEAEQNRIVQKIKEEAKKSAAQYEAKKQGLLMSLRAKAQACAEQLHADQIAHREKVQSETKYLVGQSEAKSTQLIGQAEKVVSSKLKTKREYNLHESRVEIWRQLMGKGTEQGNIVVQGSTKGNVVAQLAAVKQQQSLFNSVIAAN